MEEDQQKTLDKEVKSQSIEQCELCGSVYHRKNRARHIQTAKCKRARYIWCDRFEIKR
jgi:hypothetical protein